MNEAVLFIIGEKKADNSTGDRTSSLIRSAPTAEREHKYFAAKPVPYALQDKSEAILKKFVSKYYALKKCIESAEKIRTSYSAEQDMFKNFYDALYKMRSSGCIFRSFSKISRLFNKLAAINENEKEKMKTMTEHIIAISISPSAVISSRSANKQDYILLSPVIFLQPFMII